VTVKDKGSNYFLMSSLLLGYTVKVRVSKEYSVQRRFMCKGQNKISYKFHNNMV
jgi:hypothetical protein